MATRRRGEALESQILAAAWDELQERPWAEFRIQQVAARAQTSKSVIYRRWPDRLALALAAVHERSAVETSLDRWTGDLRADLLLLLEGAAEMFNGAFGSVFRAVVAEGAVTSSELIAGEYADAATVLVAHLVELAGLDASTIAERALFAGPAMLVFHYLMTGETPPAEQLEEIVDAVWLPALSGK